MSERPKILYILVILWPLLSLIFITWGVYSLILVLEIPTWHIDSDFFMSMLYFGSLISMITWFVFSCLFFVFSYFSFKGESWVWTAGIIISTIFIVILGLMLVSFMVTAMLFQGFFSIVGLETVVIAFLINLGIVYCITRSEIRAYFGIVR